MNSTGCKCYLLCDESKNVPLSESIYQEGRHQLNNTALAKMLQAKLEPTEVYVKIYTTFLNTNQRRFSAFLKN
jgi:hypothetical protein